MRYFQKYLYGLLKTSHPALTQQIFIEHYSKVVGNLIIFQCVLSVTDSQQQSTKQEVTIAPHLYDTLHQIVLSNRVTTLDHLLHQAVEDDLWSDG